MSPKNPNAVALGSLGGKASRKWPKAQRIARAKKAVAAREAKKLSTPTL